MTAAPTTEQQAAIGAPVGAATLVLAGPGTGKTFALVRRVEQLLATHQRPLVLSFTRAVVRELHTRLSAAERTDARYLHPVTFDSFATRLLSSVPELAGWQRWETRSYDGRIAAATAALDVLPAARAWVTARFDHIVVDEVQDLVGRRGRLVLSLLALVPQFTLLGDPAQGIYGWQEDTEGLTADGFLDAVRDRHAATLTQFHLTKNHRALNDEIRNLADFRPELMNLELAGAQRQPLRQKLLSAEPLGTLDAAVHLLPLYRGRTAVLCRTNVEALIVSEALFAANVDHVLRRSATDRMVAPWLAELVRGRKGAVARRTFLDRYEQSTLRDDMSPEDAWALLTRISGDDDRVPLDRLADAIRDGRMPDELQAGPDAGIVVSTIHRAKGLEFDSVAVVQPPEWRAVTDPAEEARVLFVAMTRTRSGLAHIKEIPTHGWSQDNAVDRWFRCRGGQRWMTLGLEIRGSDTHHMHPTGAFLYHGPVGETQERLRHNVRRGDPVDLRLVHQDDGAEPRAHYVVEHATGPVAVTGERFGRDLARRIRAKVNTANKWPLSITGVRIEGVDSVAGLEGLGQANGLGASGIWLRARVVGLGRVNWHDEGADG
jgi:hypothetical protein